MYVGTNDYLIFADNSSIYFTGIIIDIIHASSALYYYTLLSSEKAGSSEASRISRSPNKYGSPHARLISSRTRTTLVLPSDAGKPDGPMPPRAEPRFFPIHGEALDHVPRE